MKKLLIIIIALAVFYGGAALAFRDRDILPDSPHYPLKLSGEWMDVNFLTFEAPAKQAKHLVFSQRRLDEFLTLSAQNRAGKYAISLDKAYARELASAEFMAEQLALLNPKHIYGISAVYERTLAQSRRLWDAAGDQGAIGRLIVSAQIYNSRAIKTLLQKHWNTDADQKRYQAMVGEKITAVKAALRHPTAEQQARIKQAEQVLAEGRELEWAYDLTADLL